jgi:alpha,alpha-trehalase
LIFLKKGTGMPHETEPDHYDAILKPFAVKHGMDLEKFKEVYENEQVIEPELDDYFVHDRAVRESGHDTTYRFDKICAHLATIDLNSLVYKYQIDIYQMMTEHFDDAIKLHVRKGRDEIYLESFKLWCQKLSEKGVSQMIGNHGGWESSWAKGIKVYDDNLDAEYQSVCPKLDTEALASFEELPECDYFIVFLKADIFHQMSVKTHQAVDEYLWNPQKQLYFDYNCFTKKQCTYESVTCLWALWSGLSSAQQAQLMVPKALKLFEMTGGLVTGTEESRGAIGPDRPIRQWDFPYGKIIN